MPKKGVLGVLAEAEDAVDSKKDKNWIGSAIKHPGAFRRDVKRKYGEEGFDRKGRIKRSVITEMSDDPGVVGRRARLAKTLRKITTRTSRRKRAERDEDLRSKRRAARR